MGGSGSSGGGSSGKVDYPEYMKTQHQTWLTAIASLLTTAATGDSPFAADAAYDPTTRITTMDNAVCAFNGVVDALAHETDWESAVDAAVTKVDAAVIDDTYIDTDVDAYSDLLADEITNKTLPAFQGGMRDVNAVYSSAFVMGEAHIQAMKTRDVAKYSSELRVKLSLYRVELIKASVERILASLMKRVEFEQAVAHYSTESTRVGIVAFKEQTDQDILIEDLDARWDMDIYQYGANMLAAISGGAVSSSGASMSKSQSALSGAIAGASIGAPFGAPGAVIGGVLGGIGGLLF